VASWSQSDDKAQGEVRKVDHANRKITIKHGQIKSLDMPPMTMVFNVKDPALLETAQAGDKVHFAVVREDGKFVVTAIEVAP
jgi:Cu/Ag efflux protein CusF